MPIALPARLVLATSLTLPAVVAQQLESAPRTVQVQGIQAGRARDIDIPQPPRILLEDMPNKSWLTVPAGGPGLPEPISPPTTPGPNPGVGPAAAPCDFAFFLNRKVVASGMGSPSVRTGEPNTSIARDTVIYTGNFYAATSTDNGMSWTYINPSTRFPANDGGFCCDQRTIHVRSPDMTIWMLEYSYSSGTGQGSLRIARANGRNGLRGDSWTTWTLTPGTFGQGSGFFLDYSDVCFSSSHFYGSCILGNSSNNTAAAILIYRIPLSELNAGGTINISYYSSATIGGYGSFRFAQGAGSTMYWAAHTSTSNLRVWEWADSAGAATRYDRGVTAWSSTPTPAPGPDGRDWTGFGYTVNTVLTGYASSTECGFLWTSGSTGASRPQTFVRVARFDPNNSMNLLGQHDIWNSSSAWHFPACATNSRGEIGGTITFGGGTVYPSAAAFLVDSCNAYTWAPLESVYYVNGTTGPTSNRWGDFANADRAYQSATWVCAGYAATSTSSGEPHYLWFGREKDRPTWVNLNVNSLPLAGVPVTVLQTSVTGAKDGTTNFVRQYAPGQGYDLTVGTTTLQSGTSTFVFTNWRVNGVNQPNGSTSAHVSDIGSLDDTADAIFTQAPDLTVTSNRPAVSITATPDVLGAGSGTTPFTRYYLPGTAVTLSAPAQIGQEPFKRWLLNGVQATTSATTTFTFNSTSTADAQYFTYTPGSFTPYGTGCPGTNGIPLHAGGGTPEIGQTMSWGVANARPNAPCVLYIGLSNTVFNGLPLPLDLTFIGMNGCFLRQSANVSLNLGTNASGKAGINVNIPVNTGYIGVHLYTEFAIVDPAAAGALKIVHSNALDTLLGGLQ